MNDVAEVLKKYSLYALKQNKKDFDLSHNLRYIIEALAFVACVLIWKLPDELETKQKWRFSMKFSGVATYTHKQFFLFVMKCKVKY